MEAFAAASNAAGLVSLGMSLCQELLKYYESWRAAEEDVKRMYVSIETLTKTFICLRRSIQQSQQDSEILARVEESIAMCEGGIANLHRRVSKIKIAAQPNEGRSLRLNARLQRTLYPFRESTIVKLKEICTGLQGDLALALHTLQM